MLDKEYNILETAKVLHAINKPLMEDYPDKLKSWDEITDQQRKGKIIIAKELLKDFVLLDKKKWESLCFFLCDTNESVVELRLASKKLMENYNQIMKIFNFKYSHPKDFPEDFLESDGFKIKMDKSSAIKNNTDVFIVNDGINPMYYEESETTTTDGSNGQKPDSKSDHNRKESENKETES